MKIKAICDNCGASTSIEVNSIAKCEYCGSVLSSNNTIREINTIDLEERFEKSVKLFIESIDFGILDITLFNLSLSSLVEISTSNFQNRSLNKIKTIIYSQNNFDELFYRDSIETIQSFKNIKKISNPNQLEFLNQLETFITEKFKHDYIKNIKNEYDYYFDDRFKNLNDKAFQNKKNQVESLFNQKQKEIIKILTLNK
jgi:hypothetical protein